MKSRTSWLAWVTAVASIGVFTSAAFADALTDRAKRLLDQRQAKQAYDLSRCMEIAKRDPEDELAHRDPVAATAS